VWGTRLDTSKYKEVRLINGL